MFTLRRAWGIAALGAMLAATILGTTAQSEAQGAAAARAHGSARTTLLIHVSGCDRCSVQLVDAIKGVDNVSTFPRLKVGRDHVATFKVLKAETPGLSFEVRAPWAKGIDYVPNAVTAYAGHKVGSAISVKTARHAGHAAGCWAGTRKTTKDLYFEVGRVHTSSHGHQVVAPLVYARHTMSAWKPFVKAVHGTIGNQDAFYCVRPRS
jgi:hypothetical protein